MQLILEPIKFFDTGLRKVLIQSVIRNLKNKNADIRRMSNNEYAQFLIEVIKSSEEDAKPFIKYLDKLLKINTGDQFDLQSLSDL